MSEHEHEPTETTPEPEPSSPEAPDEHADDEEASEHEQHGDEPESTARAPVSPAEGESAPAVRSDKEMEKIGKQLDKLREHVASRVGLILGDDATSAIMCPMCAGLAPGWLWHPEAAPLEDGQVMAIRALLGMPTPANYKQAPGIGPCPACDAMGVVLTGSKVPGYETMDCPQCTRRGWVGVSNQPQPVTQQGNGTTSTPVVTGPTVLGTQPIANYDDDPAVKSLRERGFLVAPPLTPQVP